MSTFLTPPVWYDETGNKIDILNNKTYNGSPSNTAIGTSAVAGKPSSEGASFGAVAVGSQAKATATHSIAIGSYDDDNFRTVQALGSGSIAIGGGAIVNADAVDGIAIGRAAEALVQGGIAIGGRAKASAQGGIAIGGMAEVVVQGGIAIGENAYTTDSNVIQLGSNNIAYTLNVGNGDSTINGYIKGIAVPVGNAGFKNVTYITGGVFTQETIGGGMYVVRVDSSSGDYRTHCSFLFDIYSTSEALYSPLFKWNTQAGGDFAAVVATQVNAGEFKLGVARDAMSSGLHYITENVNISVYRISDAYPVG